MVKYLLLFLHVFKTLILMPAFSIRVNDNI